MTQSLPKLHRDHQTKLLICLVLALGTLAIYAPVRHFEFIKYDDDDYITQNPHVLTGVTRANVVWAFTRSYSSNWHPLTWVSHMLDVQVWGNHAGGHHFTNLLFHAASSVLLFLVFSRMTGALWRSAFVAAVFAWHPLHVESVAWISERKDVLSTFFAIVTIAIYLAYVHRPGRVRYVLMLVPYAFALMSKPTVVTLPFVLLLLDYWPLQRLALDRKSARKWKALLGEKLPLFFLAAVCSVITLIAQHRSAAIKSMVDIPLSVRLPNAFVSYLTYLWSSLWPRNLSIFYPLSSAVPIWDGLLAALLLVLCSAAALRAATRQPYVFVGWFWFLGTLVPMIGLVQVGFQARADRYMYFPIIGLAVLVAWTLWSFLTKLNSGRYVASALMGGASILMLLGSERQVHLWRNSFSLFKQALSVTSGNWLIENNLSNAFLTERHDPKTAEEHASRAVSLRPDYAPAHFNLGVAFLQQGKLRAAITELQNAQQLEPRWSDAHLNLGAALMVSGQTDAAIAAFYESLKLDPDSVAALQALSWVRATDPKPATRNGEEAVRLATRAGELTGYKNPAVLEVIAAARAENGEFDQAVVMEKQALELAQKSGDAELIAQGKERLDLYQLKLPYRARAH